MKCTMKRILAYKLANGDLIALEEIKTGVYVISDNTTVSVITPAFQLSNGEIIEDEKEATERVEFLNAMSRLRATTNPNNIDLIDKLAKAAEESINGIQEWQERFAECRERKEAEKKTTISDMIDELNNYRFSPKEEKSLKEAARTQYIMDILRAASLEHMRERKEAYEKAKEEKVSEFEKTTEQLRAEIKENCSDIHNLEVNKETIWKWIKSFVEHFEQVDEKISNTNIYVNHNIQDIERLTNAVEGLKKRIKELEAPKEKKRSKRLCDTFQFCHDYNKDLRDLRDAAKQYNTKKHKEKQIDSDEDFEKAITEHNKAAVQAQMVKENKGLREEVTKLRKENIKLRKANKDKTK